MRELAGPAGIANVAEQPGERLASRQGDYAAARALHEESLSIRRELGERWGIASSLNNLGNVAYAQGDYAAARMLDQQSLAVQHALGDRRGIAYTLESLAAVAYCLALPAAAARIWGRRQSGYGASSARGRRRPGNRAIAMWRRRPAPQRPMTPR